jgi:hypothetical protein
MPIEVKVTSVDEYLTWIDSLTIALLLSNKNNNTKIFYTPFFLLNSSQYMRQIFLNK